MDFDTIIIGSGVAGVAAAKTLVQAGQKVAIAENWDWGGTVINRGSTSKKIYLAAEEVKQSVECLIDHGFDTVPQIQWNKTNQLKSEIVQSTQEKLLEELDHLSIKQLKGHAQLVEEHKLSVDGTIFSAQNFIIASGAHPRELDIVGKEYFLYSQDFLNLPEMPKDIIIVGAGIISFAFAGIANAAGANVHVLQHDDRALASFDQDLVKELIAIFKQRGVHFHFNEAISEIIPMEPNQYQVKTKQGLTLVTDRVFCVAGRLPNVKNLGLEDLGIQFSEKGIEVNDHLQTTSSTIYAIGDCNDAPVPKLANYAVLQGHYAARHLLGIQKDQPVGNLNYPVPSMSVFSNPKLALAGVSTVSAQTAPDQYDIITIDMKNWLSYKRFEQSTALAKIVVEKSSGMVVGVTSLSDQADVLINYLTILLNKQISQEELERYLFAYPTLATDLHQLWQ